MNEVIIYMSWIIFSAKYVVRTWVFFHLQSLCIMPLNEIDVYIFLFSIQILLDYIFILIIIVSMAWNYKDAFGLLNTSSILLDSNFILVVVISMSNYMTIFSWPFLTKLPPFAGPYTYLIRKPLYKFLIFCIWILKWEVRYEQVGNWT